jgi:hypothetical protein
MSTTTLYKLTKMNGQIPLYTPITDPRGMLKCACKQCPEVCQCLCHSFDTTLSTVNPRHAYLVRLKTHGGFFVVGAFWSLITIFSWMGLGAIALLIAVGLLLFFWVCDLVRFFDDKRLNLAVLKARVKRK